MATLIAKVSREYTDLDLNFTAHPVRKDVNKLKGEYAVVNSIKNLIMTGHYERPFQPDIGSNIKKLLFENLDKITALSLEREIKQVVQNYEPRANILQVQVSPDIDNNGFTVVMEFSIINISDNVSVQFFLERVR